MVIDLSEKLWSLTFSTKNCKSEKINTTEKGGKVSENTELCQIFSNYFSSIISDLRIQDLINNGTCNSNINSDSVSITTKILDQSPSIIKIKKRKFDPKFNF